MIERLRGADANSLLTEVVEAMVTNETSFFRDIRPFETFKNSIVPELIEQRRPQRELNIWCAASSSGQEPYSIALLLLEYFPELQTWRINLKATDISREMLRRAETGRYSQVEANRGLPTPLLLKWFRQEGAFWQLNDRVRGMVSFSQMNLAAPWPAMPPWDVIFLRNVMIYFDNPVKKNNLGSCRSCASQRWLSIARRRRNDTEFGRFFLSRRKSEDRVLSFEAEVSTFFRPRPELLS